MTRFINALKMRPVFIRSSPSDDLIDLLFEVVSDVRPSVRPQKVLPISM